MTATDVVRPHSRNAPLPRRPMSWPWLVLGAALLPFTTFQWVIPAAAWLAPILLLRFARTQRARVALPVLAVVGYGATLVAMSGTWSAPDRYLWALPGVGIVLSYGADAFTAGRLRGLARTLTFPAVETALSFLFALDQASAFGSWGTPGYTQVTNLPLIQVTSVTGVWGLSFLILWAAPVVNDLWEHGFDLRAARRVTVPFVIVLLGAVLYGGTRLALSPATHPAVQMAALAPDRELDEARTAARVGPGPRTAAAREQQHAQHLAPVIDDLFDRTRRAARGGARIVAWSEAAAFVFAEDEAAFLEQAVAVAREERIYLEVAFVAILPTTEYPSNENRSILIDPDGAVRWDYAKATQVPGDGNALGSPILPVVDTPYGRLSVAICFDADFPWLVRQAGRAGVDVLLVPASDFGGIAPVHADMAVVRAVENGVSVLRPTRLGRSIATDPHGRTLAVSDHATSDDQTMMAAVPTAGVATPYRVVGDAVGWASAGGVVVLLGLAATARRRAAAAPSGPVRDR